MTGAKQGIHNLVAGGNTPSAQYFIFNKDSVIDSCLQGKADIYGSREVEVTTTYHAFSTTKTFTALAILQFAEKGLLELDAPAANYLPEFSFGSAVTVRQLLSHTAGIPNPIPLSWIHLSEEHATFDAAAFFSPILKKHH